MNIVQRESHANCKRAVSFHTVKAPTHMQLLETEEPEKIYYRKVVTKTMKQILRENPEAFFDGHGNLCVQGWHSAPNHFANLGETFHVVNGCGWTMEDTEWTRESLSGLLDPEV